MQASLTRWVVVTFCTLGSLGCASNKPGWWPGQKTIPYSQSSTTPPAAAQQQPQQQYPTPANGYIDQANAGGQTAIANNYQQAAGGYPIGSNPQDPYGAAANGANPYDQAYAHQQQQQMAGAYPENYPNTANPYAQPGAGGYVDPQAAGGYPGGQGYGQQGANPYGSAGAAPGYDPVRTADARQAPGGYGTNSPYDASTYGGYQQQDQYNSQTPAAPAGGYPQTQSPTDQSYPNTGGYQSGGASNGYQQGAAGYNPPGTTQYQPPTGPYADQTSTAQVDAPYRPGSTKDYAAPTAGAASTAGTGYGQPAATTAAAPGGYGNPSRYPSATGAGAAPASPQLDRYGRPIQEAAGGYGTDGTMQR